MRPFQEADRDLTLMTFVAEGFVDLLGIKNSEEYKEVADKVIREMLKSVWTGNFSTTSFEWRFRIKSRSAFE